MVNYTFKKRQLYDSIHRNLQLSCYVLIEYEYVNLLSSLSISNYEGSGQKIR